jgi:hypothetical protein
MSSLSQGTAGPSGRTGLQHSPMQLLGGNYAAPTVPTSTGLEQTSPEQSISNQIRKLTVGMLIDFFDLAQADNLPGDLSAPSKRS